MSSELAQNGHLAHGITQELQDWSNDPCDESSQALLQLVYEELHRRAHSYLRKERVGHTLQTTALVHEAYLRLAKQNNVAWESSSQFFGVAATMMRRILIDHARSNRGISGYYPRFILWA